MRWKLIVLLQWKWKIQLVNIREYVVGENQQQGFTFVCDKNSADSALLLRFYVESYATLKVQLLINHTSAQISIECILRGQGAHADIRGAYILSQEHSVAINTFQHHEACNTSSTLLMKGALHGKAFAQYHGTIRVEKPAHGAYASQENKNILLSNAARAVSVPNLEVLNNEVKCFHGSAVGRFDKDQLLYAACRGIDEESAERMLLQAFFADVVDDETGLVLFE